MSNVKFSSLKSIIYIIYTLYKQQNYNIKDGRFRIIKKIANVWCETW